MLNLVETHENLVAVPSLHYQPEFAQAVRMAMEKFKPDAVAVEMTETFATEIDWLVARWPAPVASISEGSTLPCVPGDSIVEAWRLATKQTVAKFCIDLDVAEPIERPNASLPAGEFAVRMGREFRETTDVLLKEAGPAAEGDLAREAFMAARLSELMQKYRCVLWVGGIAHWTRIVERLRHGNFASPAVKVVQRRTFRRVRLTPSALYRMTQRMPFLLARYAKNPMRYNESDSLRTLGLAACHSKKIVSLRVEGRKNDPEEDELRSKTVSVDVARMLIYARNLAASSDLRERPNLGELLTAASSTLGNRYAARLYMIAMREHLTPESAMLPGLEYDRQDGKEGYRLEGEWLSAKPYWGEVKAGGEMWIVSPDEANKKMRKPYENVSPAKEGEPKAWNPYPADETSYEAFVHYVLEHASLPDVQESKSFPFQTGRRDGVDVRDTNRHWKDGTVYVREQSNAELRVRNGIVDFSSRRENSFINRGKHVGKLGEAGWVDPSSSHVGTCSREATCPRVLQEEPFHISWRRRDISFVSLDCPNWLKDSTKKTFYDHVIVPLVNIKKPSQDNLYGWLEIMFRFCRRKTVVYYAMYVPSARIKQIARKHRVRLVHIPLSRIPKRLVKLAREFRFMNLTRTQSDELVKEIADQRNAWVPDRIPRTTRSEE